MFKSHVHVTPLQPHNISHQSPLMKRTPIPFTETEAFEIQERLDTKLEASHLSYRPAAQGTVAYLEGWKAINLANEVFGFNGWSSEILNITVDFVSALECICAVFIKLIIL